MILFGRKVPVHSYLKFVLSIFFSIASFALFSCQRHEITQNIFENVTLNSGLDQKCGMTFGTYWGDYDSDGLPDLYVTNHLNNAKLYKNLGNGHFEDVTGEKIDPEYLGGDQHGADWADFDNDGDLDLVQLTGAKRGVGAEPKRLLRNQGGRFEDVAETRGVDNPYGRCRMPLWYDIDGDGLLDLFHGADERFDEKIPPFVFIQKKNRFEASSDILKIEGRSVLYCLVTEMTGDDSPDLLCRVYEKNRASMVFDLTKRPSEALDLVPHTAFEDAAAADFDNDGKLDLFLARKYTPGRVAVANHNEKEIIADIEINKDQVELPTGFSFKSNGDLSVHVSPEVAAAGMTNDQIFIGSRGDHPTGLNFMIAPKSTVKSGLSPHTPGAVTGLFFERKSENTWQISLTTARSIFDEKGQKTFQVQIRITSSEPISKLKGIGDSIKDEKAPAKLFMNRNGKLVEEGEKRGVNNRVVSGVNVVAGDFDNDMDEDLFVLVSGAVGNQENLLLLNRGDGHFVPVAAAGGAAGEISGVGDSIAMADYDRDGFLDLLIANGGSMGRSFGVPCEDGGYSLYHNTGNSNHWLEIDLEGTKSNRDGIGAMVRVRAGDITQLRMQDGGIHNCAQNHSRLHFGLGQNQNIEWIEVKWPSGTIQRIENVKSDQVMRIQEPLS